MAPEVSLKFAAVMVLTSLGYCQLSEVRCCELLRVVEGDQTVLPVRTLQVVEEVAPTVAEAVVRVSA